MNMTTGIGLATTPRDRFAGLATDGQGQVTLKPVDLSAARGITLNADASSGRIVPELLDAGGYRVRGFSRDDATAVTGDSLRHELRWKATSVPDLPAGAYMLRLLMTGAPTAFAVTVRR